MKKLFISQPMKGKTDEEILKERKEAISLAKLMKMLKLLIHSFRMHLSMLNHYGFWVNHLSYYPQLM